jgi:hypothetical protein
MSTIEEEINDYQTNRLDNEFVVADPHVVYYDAVMHSPWNHDGGGHLPQKEDWSTYRYAVKDIILGIATHRFNKNSGRLEIRAYFVGEHPIFNELEPTKAMMIVFCCQSYQAGGTLEIMFEHGIPFDVRELIERTLKEVVSGHEYVLKKEIARKLFAALSDFSPAMQEHIHAQDKKGNGDLIEKVCYYTYRGTWSPGSIKSLVQRGVPLSWLFERKLDRIGNTAPSIHLNNQLCAVLLEEYAVRRLEDRQIGMSYGKRIQRTDETGHMYYVCDEDINIVDKENFVEMPADKNFSLLPVVPRTTGSLDTELKEALTRSKQSSFTDSPVLVVPMDFAYLSESLRTELIDRIQAENFQLVTVEQTMSQLLSEVEFNLAVTTAQADDDEIESINVDRYAD